MSYGIFVTQLTRRERKEWLPKLWQQHQQQRKPVSFRAEPDSGLTPRPPEIYVLSAASTKFMQQNCQLCCFHSCLLVCLSIHACVCVRACVCVCVFQPAGHCHTWASRQQAAGKLTDPSPCTVAALHIYVTLPELPKWPEQRRRIPASDINMRVRALKAQPVPHCENLLKIILVQHGAFL